MPVSKTRFVAGLLSVALASSGILMTASVAGAASPKSTMELLGALPQPPAVERYNGSVVHIDASTNRLYYTYGNESDGQAIHLIEYDLRPPLPQPLRDTRIASAAAFPAKSTPYTVAFDDRRQRLLFMVPNQVGENFVFVVSLKKHRVVQTWSVSRLAPGYLPMGIEYSKKDDRVYLIGDFSHSIVLGNWAIGAKAVGPGTAVLALHPNNGELAWARPIPQCQQALNTLNIGALIARSVLRDALYLACVTGGAFGMTYPGQAGLVRLNIKPKATFQDSKDFSIEFFPISGSYAGGSSSTGVAAFDPATDRFFLQSLALSTPGAWVFDGRMSGWVGFISAPDASATYSGVNEKTGHFYMGSHTGSDAKGYLVAADGRATPVPQGDVVAQRVSGFIPTDPGSRRLFVPVQIKGSSADYRWLVVQDNSPDALPLRPPDYDALTSDVPESNTTVTSYSGSINGYGARAVLVGGYAGLLGFAGKHAQLNQVRAGDRGMTAARVPTLDLREVGASATAQAVVADTNTDAEFQEGLGQEWPWTPASCLDGSGEKISESGSNQGGEVAVTCDLENQKVEAVARFAGLSGSGISIGSSRFITSARRRPSTGIETNTTASASGVELATPDGGTISIARVIAESSTVAHGRPGTAKAKWSRTLVGIEATDADGNVVYKAGECSSSAKQDECGPVIAQLNDLLGVKARISLPEPDVIRTPKGAFAGVQQSDSDFYHGRTVNNQGVTFGAESASRAVPALQLVVFNDSEERSRLIVQLAAIQANSIYTIAPAPEYDSPLPLDRSDVVDQAPTSPVGSTSSFDLGGTPAAPVAGGAASVPAPIAAPVAQALATRLAFLARTPGEALLVAAVWLIFGAAGMSVVRRRALLQILSGGSR